MGSRSVAAPAGGFRRVAILRLSSLGDVVLTLPVVHALRAAFPAARLSYWTKEEYRDVVRHDSGVDHVRILERDARRIEDLVSMSAELEECDLIVDLHASTRTRVLTFRQRAPVLRIRSLRMLRSRWVHARFSHPRPVPHALERYAATLAPIGVTTTGPPRLAVGDEAERWALEWMARAGLEAPGTLKGAVPSLAPVALCPAARHATKRWIEAHWLELDRRLAAAGRPRIYFSLARERELNPELAARVEADPDAHWCSEPLAPMAALLGRCAAAVTCDSGLMHVAAARGVRVVALFGSTAPELGFSPAGEGHVVLCRHEPCQPCTLHGRASCPRRHFRCMTGIAPATVHDALATLL